MPRKDKVSMSQQELNLGCSNLSPSRCYLSGEGMWRATISRPALFTLHMVADNGSVYHDLVISKDIFCQLMCITNGRTKYVKPKLITVRATSLYDFSYTITHTSPEATLYVKVNGEDVAGSPCTIALNVPVALHAINSGPVEVMEDLDSPYAIAVQSDRKRVVTECNKVCVYDHNGIKELTIGSEGAEFGQFNCPNGIAVDSSDNLYVADSGNHRIQKFSRSGEFLASVGQEGTKISQFKNPLGVCIDVITRKLFVTDTGNHRIQVFNNDLSFSHNFGKKGTMPGRFNHPSGVCVSVNSLVYVADTDNSRIQVLTIDGNFLRQFKPEGGLERCLDMPVDVAVDCMDTLIVTSAFNHRVFIFDPRGNIVLILGKRGEFNRLRRSQCHARMCGSGLGEYNTPTGVTVDTGGFVYIIDKSNKRMQMYL